MQVKKVNPGLTEPFVYKEVKMEFSDHRQPPREWTPWLDEWVGAMRAQGNSPRTIENW